MPLFWCIYETKKYLPKLGIIKVLLISLILGYKNKKMIYESTCGVAFNNSFSFIKQCINEEAVQHYFSNNTSLLEQTIFHVK